jgi:hypothetical protein
VDDWNQMIEKDPAETVPEASRAISHIQKLTAALICRN